MKLLDATAMAQLLAIPRDALYALLRAGNVDGAYRVGKRWRFDPERVLKSLEA